LVRPDVLEWLSSNDLLRDFSESPVTAVSPGAEGTPLVKGPDDTKNGCLALFGVNEKHLIF
jgi:hypothetical protein